MIATSSAGFNIGSFIDSLHQNRITLFTTGMQILATFLTALAAVGVAFFQIRKEFENKMVYEGWKDFLEKLFMFSSAFTNYCGKVQWLNYFLDSQDNTLVNKGDKRKYRLEKWQEASDSFIALQKANVAFLRSFESHEVLFIPLVKMKNLFQNEFRTKISDVSIEFLEKVFPEMYGSSKSYTKEELKKQIDKRWEEVTEVGIFLDDLRIELQNITIGKIMSKKLQHRKPNKGYKILTRNGFITQK